MITIYPLDNNLVWTGTAVQQDEKLPIKKAIIDPPPMLSGTEVAVRRGAQWVVLPEYPPVFVPGNDVDGLRQIAWEKIKEMRDKKIVGGGFPALGKWFHSDLVSRSQQLGLLQKAIAVEVAGGNMDAPFPGPGPGGVLPWKTMDGSFVIMTASVAKAIFSAAEAQDSALHLHGEVLWAQVQAAEDPNSVNIEAGWPTTYHDSGIA